MPPQFVKPYVKSQKNDAADAEAICEAVQRPTMRFVPVKSGEQQAVILLHRTRDLLVRQRSLISAIRAHFVRRRRSARDVQHRSTAHKLADFSRREVARVGCGDAEHSNAKCRPAVRIENLTVISVGHSQISISTLIIASSSARSWRIFSFCALRA